MTERELLRAVARRLAIIRHAEEVTGNVALTCRYYGISRTLFYTWRRRYEELGIEGLRPRSRRPHTSPNATSGEVIGKIVHLRKNYHFGPAKISMYLGSGPRQHDADPLRGRRGSFDINRREDGGRTGLSMPSARSGGGQQRDGQRRKQCDGE
jgi:hypothetical protein